MSDDPDTRKLLVKITRLEGELDQLRLNVSRVRVDGGQMRDAMAELAVGVADIMSILLARFAQVDREMADMHGSIKLAADILGRQKNGSAR